MFNTVILLVVAHLYRHRPLVPLKNYARAIPFWNFLIIYANDYAMICGIEEAP